MRTFIYGSCVSRDLYALLDQDRYKLLHYTARQSLVSAYSVPRIDDIDSAALTSLSPFNSRTVTDDWRSSLLPDLAEHAGNIDLLLWDLADERLGFLQSPTGTMTRSVLSQADRSLEYPNAVHVDFGTDEHFAAWRKAAAQFHQDLQGMGILNKTLVLAIPWASHRIDGHLTPTSFGLDADTANQRYERYYDELRDLGFAILSVPRATVRSDPKHKWGDAPFHYTEAVYKSIATRIPVSPATPEIKRKYGWDSLVDPWVDSIPVKAEKLPSAYRIWQSARRYHSKGDLERAEQCVQLNKLLHNSYVPAELELGKDVLFGYGGMGVVVHKDCDIREGVTIAPNVTLGGNGHPTRFDARRNTTSTVPQVMPYAVISAGSRILGGVTIGAFAIIAPNSVVNRDVPAGTIVAGAPAKEIGRVTMENALRYRAKYLPLRGADEETFLATFRTATESTTEEVSEE